MDNNKQNLDLIIEQLANMKDYQTLCYKHAENKPMPSIDALEKIVSIARSILFPGYFGNSAINSSTIKNTFHAMFGNWKNFTNQIFGIYALLATTIKNKTLAQIFIINLLSDCRYS